MGRLEERGASRSRKEKIQQVALETLKLGGLLAIAIAAPNAVQGLKRLGLVPGPRQGESMRRTYRRLVEKGYARREAAGLRLTALGARELERLQSVADLQARNQKKWDGKWRVLIFDIPEKNRRLRDRIREMLRHLGFVRLQDSVWVFPYNCEDLVALLKSEWRIGYKMRYMVVQELEGEASLKRDFGLA